MIISLFESVNRAYTYKDRIISASWEEIAELLLTHNDAETKEEVPLFNLWEFRTENFELGRRRKYKRGVPTDEYEEIPDTIRRCKANSIGLHGLVLDYDGNKTFNDAVNLFKDCGIEAVFYTTFRHTETCDKFRVVVPFTHAITSAELALKKEHIADTFPGVDHASFSESQCFYLHSGKTPKTYWNKGVLLNPDWFENKVVEETEPKPVREFTGDDEYYKKTLIESLLTCSGLHYANEQSRYGVLTLVALCKSAGVTFDEFDTICWHIAAADSSLKNPQQRKLAWVGWVPHSGITAKVREEFIKAYNGTSKFLPASDWRNVRAKLVNKYKIVEN